VKALAFSMKHNCEEILSVMESGPLMENTGD